MTTTTSEKRYSTKNRIAWVVFGVFWVLLGVSMSSHDNRSAGLVFILLGVGWIALAGGYAIYYSIRDRR